MAKAYASSKPNVGPLPGRRNPQNTASLYVGDLATNVTEAELFKLFNAVGPVASIRVCRDAVSKRSLGYGYVNFHNASDAERALDTLNFTAVHKVPVRIMWAERDPARRRAGKGNVIVKKLDKTIDHKTLYDTFSIFGDILSCKVALNPETKESLSYGFVHFAEESSALECVAKVNDMEIAGKKVSVEMFKPMIERIRDYTNIYVKNVPGDFSEEQFQELFEKYGPLAKLYDGAKAPFIMAKPRVPGIDTYWGFCNYKEHKDAESAVNALSGEMIKSEEDKEGKELFCTRALTRGEKLKRRQDRFTKMRDKRRQNSKFVNVFVKNLSEKIDDARLKLLFKDFGEITSVKVAEGDDGHSKGFGFVCYKNPDEATRAITEMNTKIVEGKPLYVAPHQPKEERSIELNRRFSAQNRSYQQQSPSRYSTPGRNTRPSYNQQTPSYGNQYASTGYGNQYAQQTPYRPNANPFYQQQTAQYPQMIQQQPRNVMRPMGGYNQRPPPAPAPRRPSYHAPTNFTPSGSYHPAGHAPPPPPHHQHSHSGSTPPYVSTPSRRSSRRSSTGSSNNWREDLTKSDPQQQKQMIGEKLFPLIQSREPKLAGKITGMLLEMDNTELLHLLDTPKSLHVKINEALHVLRKHQQDIQTRTQPPNAMVNTPLKSGSQGAYSQITPHGIAGDNASPE